ncbi:5-methylthioadenosine/S-adenosylhomocysteine deaminase [Sedimentibacter acidaminivorans]|uniref:5-methylthioadenosine/S-adenosylhomocysteine deaminase n=1 Tax=Sedimentibacter acidaminivorans TaxID=913099 RepID=A0ABS4GA18_9FIRM|nr:amidohydrolase [Sedimentibacter acidaminivorans]MBP1924535.1 5-methylthioadenosine/S-adenosylhomocysteine deaminase [Sedimentibacter acidaminivorans]
MKKILLKNGTIIDENGRIIENTDVYISSGKIEKLSKRDDLIISDYETIDCSGYYITPSFVNLHAHSPMNILKGIAEDVTIDDWFNKKIFPYESKLKAEEIYWGTMLASAEMINNGVTAFADHYFSQESVYRAINDIGIRGDIAPTIFGLADDYKIQLKNAEQFIKEFNGKNSRINIRLGPHAPYTCPGDILKEIVDTAKSLNVGIHIHVSETKEQVDDSLKLTGKTPVEILYDSGAFDLDVIIAHGLWTTEDDLKYLNDNVNFALCPKTYMKLSMGQGNIYKLKEKLNYSFGTDGAASSNTLSPLEQARLFALNGKFILGNSESFNILEIWRALMNGHNALSFNTGKIKAGCEADLLIWDLNMLNTSPVYNPLTSIIYSAESNNIKYTMVQGEFLKYDGKLKAYTNNVIKKVNDIQKDIIERGTGESKVKY